MNEEINSWLNSDRDYQAGVSLYEKYGVSATQKRLLRKGGESKKNMATLVYELGKLSKVPVKKTMVIKKPVVVRRIPPPVQPVSTPSKRPLAPEAEELRQKMIGMLKIQSNMQSTLELLPADEERKKAVKQIIQLDTEIADIYRRLEHYDKHGVIPPPAKKEKKEKPAVDITSLSDIEVMKRLSTLKTYISRYRVKLKKLKDEKKKLRAQTQLDKYLSEMEIIDRRLKK